MRLGLLWIVDDDPGCAAPSHARIVECAVSAEALGFDAMWIGDRRSRSSSSPPTAAAIPLAAAAARTRRIRLGASVALFSDHDPLRVAEDFATLDGISSGRVELVAGGGLLCDADAEGPDDRERLRENLELLQRLWRETEVRWSGRFRAGLDGVRVVPRPVQQPHPPVWLGSGVSARAELAADLGLPLMLPSLLAPAAELRATVDRYRERFARAGHDGEPQVGACSLVELRRVEPLASERGRASSAMCGSPAEIADRIGAAADALGLDLFLSAFDPSDQQQPTLEIFAAEALPALRQARLGDPGSLAARGALR